MIGLLEGIPGLLGNLLGVSAILEITTRLLLRNSNLLLQSIIALISPPSLAIAPNEFSSIVFSLEVTDNLGATSVDYITIIVGEPGEMEILDIINNF